MKLRWIILPGLILILSACNGADLQDHLDTLQDQIFEESIFNIAFDGEEIDLLYDESGSIYYDHIETFSENNSCLVTIKNIGGGTLELVHPSEISPTPEDGYKNFAYLCPLQGEFAFLDDSSVGEENVYFEDEINFTVQLTDDKGYNTPSVLLCIGVYVTDESTGSDVQSLRINSYLLTTDTGSYTMPSSPPDLQKSLIGSYYILKEDGSLWASSQLLTIKGYSSTEVRYQTSEDQTSPLYINPMVNPLFSYYESFEKVENGKTLLAIDMTANVNSNQRIFGLEADGSLHYFAVAQPQTSEYTSSYEYPDDSDNFHPFYDPEYLVSESINSSFLGHIDDIICGYDHVLVLKDDKTVWGVYGSNNSGQMGNGTTDEISAPVQVTSLSDVVEIQAGNQFSMALKSDGTVWTWGSNSSGTLGIGNTTNSSVPVQITSLTDVTHIACSNLNGFALREDGTVWSWGSNVGPLGYEYDTNRLLPKQIAGLNGVAAVYGGQDSFYGLAAAILTDGTVKAWGSSSNVTSGTPIYTPLLIEGMENIETVSVDGSTITAISEDGSVWTYWFSSENESSAGEIVQFNIKEY